MLKSLLGSQTREKALVFIKARGRGYPLEIANFFEISVRQVQNQLDRLEAGSIVVSQKIGTVRLYEFNPRLFCLAELDALLKKILTYYPPEIRDRLMFNRRRPRRRNKPL